MEEVGKVVKIEDSYAIVSVDKHKECKKCGMCAFPKNATASEFRAENGVGANVGDTVKISTSEKGKWLGILLVFGVPLLIIGGVFAIAFFNGWSEVLMPLIGVGAIIIWFIVLGVLDKKLKKLNAFASMIIGIISTTTEENNTESETAEFSDTSDNISEDENAGE